MAAREYRRIPKEYREIVERLIRQQGWRYDEDRKGHPMLYPTDRAQRPIPVPTTPGSQGLLRGWKAQIRRAGGLV